MRVSARSWFPFFAAVAVGTLGAGNATSKPMFQGLGSLSAGGTSQASDVSADGTTVVGFSAATQGGEAFRWTANEGMVSLGELPGLGSHDSRAAGVSADGEVVVGSSRNGRQAFRWTADEGMVGLGGLPGGRTRSSARATTGDGAVVVGLSSSSATPNDFSNEAFLWTDLTGMVGLGGIPGADVVNTRALDVSADGSILVGSGQGPAGPEAFFRTQTDGIVGIGDLPGGSFSSQSIAVSLDGSVIVGQGSSDLGREAFRWTEAGGMVGLGDLPGGSFSSMARDVSADGSVVVGQGRTTTNSSEAFIWDASRGMRQVDQVLEDLGLDVAGWQLLWASGVSADGRTLVGAGFNPDGVAEGWIAVVPEPSTGMLLGLGLGLLSALRRLAS